MSRITHDIAISARWQFSGSDLILRVDRFDRFAVVVPSLECLGIRLCDRWEFSAKLILDEPKRRL